MKNLGSKNSNKIDAHTQTIVLCQLFYWDYFTDWTQTRTDHGISWTHRDCTPIPQPSLTFTKMLRHAPCNVEFVNPPRSEMGNNPPSPCIATTSFLLHLHLRFMWGISDRIHAHKLPTQIWTSSFIVVIRTVTTLPVRSVNKTLPM